MFSLARFVSLLVQAYEFLIFIRVLLSWLNVSRASPRIDHPAVRFLNQVTDPVLEPLRRLVPPIAGTIDLSPIIALILLEIVRRILFSFLVGL